MHNFEMLRRAKGLSQCNVGVALGVSQAAVALWESGKSIPRAEKLPEIAKVLGCTIDDLFANRSDKK